MNFLFLCPHARRARRYLTPWRARFRCPDSKRRLPPSARFAASWEPPAAGGGGGGFLFGASDALGRSGGGAAAASGASSRDRAPPMPLNGDPGDFTNKDAEKLEELWQYWIAVHYWVRAVGMGSGGWCVRHVCVCVCAGGGGGGRGCGA